ncbi:hypothetical protein XH98_30415 [Bradyrhizobium sp. CCBAU 51745]|nr:hypothetical protein [Bradyrhizobium sp. CCBAU 51745]
MRQAILSVAPPAVADKQEQSPSDGQLIREIGRNTAIPWGSRITLLVALRVTQFSIRDGIAFAGMKSVNL